MRLSTLNAAHSLIEFPELLSGHPQAHSSNISMVSEEQFSKDTKYF